MYYMCTYIYIYIEILYACIHTAGYYTQNDIGNLRVLMKLDLLRK